MSDEYVEQLHDFVREVTASGEVWGLEHDEGWALAPSVDDESVSVMPFWSDESAAAACASDEWSEYRASPIPLDDFLDDWLPGMAEDGYRVGVGWDDDLLGPELDPIDLQEELENALDRRIDSKDH